jgi:hypothetical protein
LIRAVVFALLLSGSIELSPASRVEGERAVELERYQFVIGNDAWFKRVRVSP